MHCKTIITTQNIQVQFKYSFQSFSCTLFTVQITVFNCVLNQHVHINLKYSCTVNTFSAKNTVFHCIQISMFFCWSFTFNYYPSLQFFNCTLFNAQITAFHCVLNSAEYICSVLMKYCTHEVFTFCVFQTQIRKILGNEY